MRFLVVGDTVCPVCRLPATINQNQTTNKQDQLMTLSQDEPSCAKLRPPINFKSFKIKVEYFPL